MDDEDADENEIGNVGNDGDVDMVDRSSSKTKKTKVSSKRTNKLIINSSKITNDEEDFVEYIPDDDELLDVNTTYRMIIKGTHFTVPSYCLPPGMKNINSAFSGSSSINIPAAGSVLNLNSSSSSSSSGDFSSGLFG